MAMLEMPSHLFPGLRPRQPLGHVNYRGAELPLRVSCSLCSSPFTVEKFRRRFPTKLDSFKTENSRTIPSKKSYKFLDFLNQSSNPLFPGTIMQHQSRVSGQPWLPPCL